MGFETTQSSQMETRQNRQMVIMASNLIIRAVEAACDVPLEVDLGGGLLQEVGDPLHQEVSVFQVGEQEGHSVLGADGQRAGQDVGAVCFLYNGHLRDRC